MLGQAHCYKDTAHLVMDMHTHTLVRTNPHPRTETHGVLPVDTVTTISFPQHTLHRDLLSYTVTCRF